ncbi:MAG TPA: glycosyl transferase family 2 protein [Desulfotomaculum sp.]|nr:glycosyl transferase family 2 protein [Desulfotomaculum sp.]
MQLVWKARFFDITGYSNAARGYVTALDGMGANIKLIPVGKGTPLKIPEITRETIYRLAGRPFEKYSNIVFVRHSIPDRFEKFGRFSMGVTAWESDRIHPLWRDWSNAMDALAVPSAMNIEAFTGGGVHKSVELVRYGVDQAFISPGEYRDVLAGKNAPPFRFLSVFDWIYRKGYDLLVQAFWKEFSLRDGVCLVIKTGFGRTLTGARENILADMRRLKERVRPPRGVAPVYFFTGDASPANMVNLYRSCHCFVLPSRGEGAGLPLLEAGSLGMPVIATGWGGQTDFLNDQNSYPVSYQLEPVPYQRHCPYYRQDQNWARPDMDDLRKKMRAALEDRPTAREKGRQLQELVTSRYTWEAAAGDVLEVVSKLAGVEVT